MQVHLIRSGAPSDMFLSNNPRISKRQMDRIRKTEGWLLTVHWMTPLFSDWNGQRHSGLDIICSVSFKSMFYLIFSSNGQMWQHNLQISYRGSLINIVHFHRWPHKDEKASGPDWGGVRGVGCSSCETGISLVDLKSSLIAAPHCTTRPGSARVKTPN